MAVTDIIVSVHLLDESAKKYLVGCISSIIQYTPREDYKLICVIDRGWEGTAEFLEEYRRKGWVDLVLENRDQRGWTTTNNIGLETSYSDFAILLNMDTVVSEGWLSGLIDCAQRNCSDVVGCKLIDEAGRINHAGAYGVGFHKGMNEQNISYFAEEPAEWVTGACMLISRNARELVGNLPKQWPHWGSDREFCKSVREAGGKVWYSPVTILHYTEKSKSTETDEYFKDMPR